MSFTKFLSPFLNPRDEVREKLDKQAKILSDTFLKTVGEGSIDKQIEKLERLDKLVKIQQDVAQPPLLKRWFMVVILVGIFLVIFYFAFDRRATTEIELELTLSEVSFVLSEPMMLTDAMMLSALGVSKL